MLDCGCAIPDPQVASRPHDRALFGIPWRLGDTHIEQNHVVSLARGAKKPIVKITRVPIRAGDSMERLRKRFEPIMVDLMLDGIRLARDGALAPRPQTEKQGRQYYVMHPRLYAETRRRLTARSRES